MTTATVNHDLYTDVNRRHDFTLLFDVTDGNPNGDPDMGNQPRVDPETMQGLVTDVCLKRKVRDWVAAKKSEAATAGDGKRHGYDIYVKSGTTLIVAHEQAYAAINKKPTGQKQKREDVEAVRDEMCRRFYDVRMFGAVMALDVNAGQVRGPIQLTFARSIDRVLTLDLAITRVAVATRKETEEGKISMFGRKNLIPYGLYLAHGFFNPHFATRTGVNGDDLALFWQALQNMWDFDRSAARGMMACRGLYIFSHDSKLGDAPAHKLFERIKVEQQPGLVAPRSFDEYIITVNEQDMPEGVTLTKLSC